MPETKPLDPLLGQQLSDYAIETVLGRGGMACVYRAVDVKQQRHVALKVLLWTAYPQSSQQRFEREARAIAKLKHQHIVGIHDFNKAGDIYYIAMEYIDGADLHWVLDNYRDNQEFMDYQTMLKIIEQIAEALDYSHLHGIIHRDVKPSNIMINRQGDAILTDFNLALILSEGTAGEAFGTPHYISPEQAMNSADVVPQSDLYSLGVVLYEILTGTVPFTARDALRVATAHLSEPLPDPRVRNPNLHPAFADVLERALAKTPQDRYPTGKTFIKALRKAVKVSERTIPSNPSKTSLKQRITQHPPQLPATPPLRPTRPQAFISIFSFARQHRILFSLLVLILGLLAVSAISLMRPEGRIELHVETPEVYFRNGEEIRVSALWQLVAAGERIQQITWSVDGQYIAGAGVNGNIIIWEADSGRISQRWHAHDGAVNVLAWQPDGDDVLISGGDDKRLRFWNIHEHTEPIQTLLGHGEGIVAIAWSSDSSQIISGDQSGSIILWLFDNSWRRSTTQFTSTLQTLDWSNDGIHVVLGGMDQGVRLWDAVSGSSVLLGTHEESIHAVDWGPFSERFVAISDDGDVRLWDTGSGDYTRLAWGLHNAADAGFNRDETRVAVAHGTEVSVWDAATGIRVAILDIGNNQSIRSIDWNPNGTQLVAVTEMGTVRIWSVPSTIPQRFTSGEVLEAEGRISHMTWDTTGSRIATVGSNGGITLWDSTDYAPLFSLDSVHSTDISVVAWHPRSEIIATGGCDGNIALIDIETQSVIQQLSRHTGCVTGLAFSSDGQQLWSVDNTGRLRVWNLETYSVLLARDNLHNGSIMTLTGTNGSRYATIGADGRLRIWGVVMNSLQTLIEYNVPNTLITVSSWNSEDSTLVIGDAMGRIRIWNNPFEANSNREFTQLPNTVRALAVNPTGDYMAAIDLDGCLTLWTMPTAERLFVQCAPSSQPYRALAWHPRQNILAVRTESGEIIFWQVS